MKSDSKDQCDVFIIQGSIKKNTSHLYLGLFKTFVLTDYRQVVDSNEGGVKETESHRRCFSSILAFVEFDQGLHENDDNTLFTFMTLFDPANISGGPVPANRQRNIKRS